jgi:hypothetical protein
VEKCPFCKARYRQGGACARCEADLRQLLIIEADAGRLARRAIHGLLSGDSATSRKQAAAACALHATPFHRALEGFCKTVQGVDGT